jgi:hypothetical protein
MRRKIKSMKLAGVVLAFITGLMSLTASAAPSQWEQPAASLASQISEILGPGQARMTIRNNSLLSNDEIPAIRRLLEADLKSHGILASGAESANTIRVTLSENQRERLWVAEIIEGNETHVAMVHVDMGFAPSGPARERIVLRRETYLTHAGLNGLSGNLSDEPVLAMTSINSGLVVLQQDQIVIVSMTTVGWMARKRMDLNLRQQLARDPRGLLISSADGNGFMAEIAGAECIGRYSPPPSDAIGGEGDWSLHCHESDDPWPIAAAQDSSANSTTTIKAFYNAARNYFTGVVTPSVGVDLPPFYSAALLPRPDGAGLLINGIDGKVQLAESNTLKPVSGTRDWGSDFAALHSGCGAGTQIIASGSGEAITDSLRAYELPALEAVPASAPLAMDGTVTALWTAPDGKSLYAVVRNASDQYEVDRVTATCN